MKNKRISIWRSQLKNQVNKAYKEGQTIGFNNAMRVVFDFLDVDGKVTEEMFKFKKYPTIEKELNKIKKKYNEI